MSTLVLGRAMIARQPQMLQMPAVETGQMPAVETGQMSAAGTGQMSAVDRDKTDVYYCDRALPCLDTINLSCLNSRHLSHLSSRHLSCLNSRHLSCLNRRHLGRGRKLFRSLFYTQNIQNGTHPAEPDGARRNGGRDVETEPRRPRVMARITAVKQTPSNK